MRKNFPIFDHETKVGANQYLISRTDLKGRITYANPAFIEISGFSREELIGKAHNIVRHPDVPPLLYQDLWDTLQAGKPWLGVVKNRRKDGGFYWVLANAAAIVQDGEVTGYTSVRVRPSEEQIIAAQQLYDEINADRHRGYTVRGGQKVTTGWRRLLGAAAAPFAPGLRSAMFRQSALALGAIAVASTYAFSDGIATGGAWWALSLVGLLTAGSLGYGWIIARRVLRSLNHVADTTHQIAAGNLAVHIPSDETDLVGNVYTSLDLMRRSLVHIANDVREGIEAANHTAHMVTTSNHELSLRTDDQAASLQSTAASMEELTITVQQNTANAEQANHLADDSMRIAQRGGQVVSEVVATMQAIHDSSRKIGDIVTLIEEIAFQTNILALNAAVESARAGEAGRGFAVVAGEVRSLAQRSSKAAGEIKSLIDTSVASMATGSQQAEHAGNTMQEIVNAVRRVSDIISEISLASNEQTVGLLQINEAITQIDGATRDNAALVQALGQTVAMLANETDSLHHTIEGLSTHEGQRAANEAAARARRNPHQAHKHPVQADEDEAVTAATLETASPPLALAHH